MQWSSPHTSGEEGCSAECQAIASNKLLLSSFRCNAGMTSWRLEPVFINRTSPNYFINGTVQQCRYDQWQHSTYVSRVTDDIARGVCIALNCTTGRISSCTTTCIQLQYCYFLCIGSHHAPLSISCSQCRLEACSSLSTNLSCTLHSGVATVSCLPGIIIDKCIRISG